MKKLISSIAVVALLFSMNVSAQEVKKAKKTKEKAKTEKTCSAEEKKSCAGEKKGSCCAAKKA